MDFYNCNRIDTIHKRCSNSMTIVPSTSERTVAYSLSNRIDTIHTRCDDAMTIVPLTKERTVAYSLKRGSTFMPAMRLVAFTMAPINLEGYTRPTLNAAVNAVRSASAPNIRAVTDIDDSRPNNPDPARPRYRIPNNIASTRVACAVSSSRYDDGSPSRRIGA